VKWKKMGLIYGPQGDSGWARHSALQPTPLLRQADGVIRVFVGFRDDEGVGRVGFIDLSARNPSEVLRVSDQPALDIGLPGTFDEDGVVPCAIVERDGRFYLYYAGYQQGRKVKFCAYGGLAISDDGGNTFVRYSKTPISDRTDTELYFRVAHSVMHDAGVWKIWYGAGSAYLHKGGQQLPSYNIKYVESPDGLSFGEGSVVIDLQHANEYRVGRPYVIKDDGKFKMFYSVGTTDKLFRLGYAESPDGVNWKRMDDRISLNVSDSGWDSEMIAYPSIVKYAGSTYLFYNGNDYGRDGFGYAVLEE
jgi:predicted GH43/DUF377 family glycosyl hydrolase